MKRLWNFLNTLSPLGVGLVITVDLAVGLVFRFSTTSKLWLDEALGVNIASGSWGQIIDRLRNDGAPPLYYFVLHVWMKLFGDSDRAIRSLSGLFSVLALGATYLLARRLFDARFARVALAVVAVLPFTVYFATEARMYSLVTLESALFLLVWTGNWTNGTLKKVLSLAILTAALLYTHYWSIYFLSIFALVLVFDAWRNRFIGGVTRARGVAILAGGVAWLPWLPIFNEQRLHTGTPWSPSPSFFQFLNWIEGFVTNQSRQHITPSLHHEVALLSFIFLIVVGSLALFMMRGSLVELDVRIPRDIRLIVTVVFGTMLLGLLAAHFGHTTFVPRYASVIAIPLVLIVARGMLVFDKPLRVFIVLALFSGAALWTDKWGRQVQRTQAGQVAQVLTSASPNAYVFFCPDQLGPSVLRYSRSDLDYSSYPRYTNPALVNWYDYKQAFAQTSPRSAGERVVAAAGGRDIYVIWSAGYTLKATCRHVVREIAAASGRTPTKLLKARFNGFYQSMNVTYLPHR